MATLPAILSKGTKSYLLCNSVGACFTTEFRKSVLVFLHGGFCNASIVLSNSIQILSLQSINSAVGINSAVYYQSHLKYFS